MMEKFTLKNEMARITLASIALLITGLMTTPLMPPNVDAQNLKARQIEKGSVLRISETSPRAQKTRTDRKRTHAKVKTNHQLVADNRGR